MLDFVFRNSQWEFLTSFNGVIDFFDFVVIFDEMFRIDNFYR